MALRSNVRQLKLLKKYATQKSFITCVYFSLFVVFFIVMIILNVTLILHIQKSVENFCLSDKKDDIPVNASKHSSVSEHLVNN